MTETDSDDEETTTGLEGRMYGPGSGPGGMNRFVAMPSSGPHLVHLDLSKLTDSAVRLTSTKSPGKTFTSPTVPTPEEENAGENRGFGPGATSKPVSTAPPRVSAAAQKYERESEWIDLSGGIGIIDFNSPATPLKSPAPTGNPSWKKDPLATGLPPSEMPKKEPEVQASNIWMSHVPIVDLDLSMLAGFDAPPTKNPDIDLTSAAGTSKPAQTSDGPGKEDQKARPLPGMFASKPGMPKPVMGKPNKMPQRPQQVQKPGPPNRPAQPVRPAHPARPGQPQRPAHPARPGQPQRPGRPSRPVNPSIPANPSLPVNARPNRPATAPKPVIGNRPVNQRPNNQPESHREVTQKPSGPPPTGDSGVGPKPTGSGPKPTGGPSGMPPTSNPDFEEPTTTIFTSTMDTTSTGSTMSTIGTTKVPTPILTSGTTRPPIGTSPTQGPIGTSPTKDPQIIIDFTEPETSTVDTTTTMTTTTMVSTTSGATTEGNSIDLTPPPHTFAPITQSSSEMFTTDDFEGIFHGEEVNIVYVTTDEGQQFRARFAFEWEFLPENYTELGFEEYQLPEEFDAMCDAENFYLASAEPFQKDVKNALDRDHSSG